MTEPRIGPAMRLIREQSGISIEQVAQRLGVAVDTARGRETGSTPRWSTVIEWLRVCGADLTDMAAVYGHEGTTNGDGTLEQPERLVLVFSDDEDAVRVGDIRTVGHKVCLVDRDNQMILEGDSFDELVGQIPSGVKVFEPLR